MARATFCASHLLEKGTVRVPHERDGAAVAPRARRASDAVEVGGQGAWRFIVDDRLDAQDVQPTRRHVRAEKELGVPTPAQTRESP